MFHCTGVRVTVNRGTLYIKRSRLLRYPTLPCPSWSYKTISAHLLTVSLNTKMEVTLGLDSAHLWYLRKFPKVWHALCYILSYLHIMYTFEMMWLCHLNIVTLTDACDNHMICTFELIHSSLDYMIECRVFTHWRRLSVHLGYPSFHLVAVESVSHPSKPPMKPPMKPPIKPASRASRPASTEEFLEIIEIMHHKGKTAFSEEFNVRHVYVFVFYSSWCRVDDI